MEDKKIISLKYPIPDNDGKDTSEIAIGRFKVKHLKLLPKDLISGDKEKANIDPIEIMPLLAGMAGLSISSVEELDIDDLQTVMESIKSFFPQ